MEASNAHELLILALVDVELYTKYYEGLWATTVWSKFKRALTIWCENENIVNKFATILSLFNLT